MAFVFLSYTQKDSAAADQVETALRARGHRVWRDSSSLGGGTPIPLGVAKGMSLCDHFAIVVTKNAIASPWIPAELNLFIGDPTRWDRILPLKFDGTFPGDLSPFLKLLNPKWIDFTRSFDDGLREVLNVIGPAEEDVSQGKVADLSRLRFAIDLAVRAGNVAMRFYNASIGPNEPLDARKSATTRADLAAQNEVVARLTTHHEYSSDALVAEEKPFHDESRVQEQGYTWVIDPIDGTVNFDNRIPMFCTAIGCLRDGRPHIGVVYDPVENEVYYAMDGLATEVWNVSKGEVQPVRADQSTTDIDKSVLGIHISSRPKVAERLLASGILLDLSREVRHLRALGCGQLALAYVASGRLQGFLQLETALWDQVAGVVLIRCAGGSVSDLRSRPDCDWTWRTKDVLAAGNDRVRDGLLKFWSARAPW